MTSWAAAPIVTIAPPPKAYCPECSHPHFTIIRTMATEDDGLIIRRCVCHRCSSRFLVLVDSELAASDWQD